MRAAAIDAPAGRAALAAQPEVVAADARDPRAADSTIVAPSAGAVSIQLPCRRNVRFVERDRRTRRAAHGRSRSGGVARNARPDLFARVSCFKLVPNSQNEDGVLGRKPTVLRDVAVTAA